MLTIKTEPPANSPAMITRLGCARATPVFFSPLLAAIAVVMFGLRGWL
jgi:hypothetical protein